LLGEEKVSAFILITNLYAATCQTNGKEKSIAKGKWNARINYQQIYQCEE
jgi:hypothetical protein